MEEVKILDHGYVKYIEHWGSDERIIEAARMSTQKGFLGWGEPERAECPHCKRTASPVMTGGICWTCGSNPTVAPGDAVMRLILPKTGDEKLLRYLYEHRHDTPFEFAGLVIEVQAPIMVFREWHRHRTQSYNEMSARYTPLPDFNYSPTVDRCMVVSSTNKQAGAASDATLTHETVLEWLEELNRAYNVAEAVYQSGLRRGIPKELARLPVPVGRYSRMRAQANLRNWLAFLTLRSDKNPHAQWEIRQFANVVADIIKAKFPRTYELFVEGKR